MKNNKSTAACGAITESTVVFGDARAKQAFEAVLASIKDPKERWLLRRKLVGVYWEEWDNEDRVYYDPHIFDKLIFLYRRINLHTMEHIGRILAFVPRNLHPNFNFAVEVTGLGINERRRFGYICLDSSN